MHKGCLGRLAAAIAVSFLALPARAADQALIDAAKKEGTVTWYTTLILNQLGTPLAEAFQKKYGIKVEATRNDPGETAMRLLNEQRANNMQADVYDGTFAANALIREGVLMKWQPDIIKQFPAELYDPNGYWTAYRLTVMTAAYNTSLVPAGTEPKTWDDLLDPKWRGKIAWGANPGITAGPGFCGLVLSVMGEEKGMAFLKKLAGQQIAGLKISSRAVIDQVIAGEYAIALQILNDNVVISRSKGAPIAWTPLNSAMSAVSIISVMNKARHPNAGKLLLDFVVSEEGQAVMRDHDYIPSNPKVAPRDPDVRPDGKLHFTSFNISPNDLESKMPEWQKVYDDLFR